MAICTLFEGSYHYGLGALANSLHARGYRGPIYAGYRGPLAGWAAAATEDPSLGWEGARTLQVDDGLPIHFLPLQTDYHLTNFKPDFMLMLFEGIAKDRNYMFYLDPDICVEARWDYFMEWIDCGVALCEDVNSPLTENNPRRVAWRKYFEGFGIPLKFRQETYVNGGFLGLKRSHIEFLSVWKKIQEVMGQRMGGLGASKLGGGSSELMRDPLFCFSSSDQDALNATVEATHGIPTSILEGDAMGFKHGNCILPHALGTPKPWLKRYISSALEGHPPTMADKVFWSRTETPLRLFPNDKLKTARISLRLGAAIGRFIRKN